MVAEFDEPRINLKENSELCYAQRCKRGVLELNNHENMSVAKMRVP